MNEMLSQLIEWYLSASSSERKRIDRQYKEFIASCGCIVTRRGDVELHHLRIVGKSGVIGSGMGKRPADIMCIPLTVEMHRTGRYAIHRIGNKNFEDLHCINLLDELKILHDRFINDLGIRL